jgi:hypothetical protein
MPVCRESRDRDICPSCEFGSRSSDIARCLSSSESLMWSERRNSCAALVAAMFADLIYEERERLGFVIIVLIDLGSSTKAGPFVHIG